MRCFELRSLRTDRVLDVRHQVDNRARALRPLAEPVRAVEIEERHACAMPVDLVCQLCGRSYGQYRR